MSCCCGPLVLASPGSQLLLPGLGAARPSAAGLRPPGGAAAPSPGSGRASPVGVSLPLALSPPGLTSGSGARPPLSVLVRARRGPGRGAINGGGGRRSGGHAQLGAPETLDSKPHNFPGSAAAPGAWTEGEAEAGSLGGSGGEPGSLEPAAGAVVESARASRRRGPRLLPRALPSVAEPEPRAEPSPGLRGASRAAPRRAQPGPLLATSGPCCSGAPRAREAGVGAPRGFSGRGGSRAARSPRRPGVVGPGPGSCMRGGAAVSRRRRWKA